MWDVIEKYPSFVIDMIKRTKFKIVLVEKEGYLEKKFGYSAIKGFYHTAANTLYVESFVRDGVCEKYLQKGVSEKDIVGLNDRSLSLKVSIDTMVHELTHLIDYNGGYPSQKREFKIIHQEEWRLYRNTTNYRVENRLVDKNIDTPREYFAQAFVSYMFHPEELIIYCPKTYAYIDNFVKTKQQEYEDKNKKPTSNLVYTLKKTI